MNVSTDNLLIQVLSSAFRISDLDVFDVAEPWCNFSQLPIDIADDLMYVIDLNVPKHCKNDQGVRKSLAVSLALMPWLALTNFLPRIEREWGCNLFDELRNDVPEHLQTCYATRRYIADLVARFAGFGQWMQADVIKELAAIPIQGFQ